jgi:hypothetical protein
MLVGATSAGCANRGTDLGMPALLTGTSGSSKLPMFAKRAAADRQTARAAIRRATGSRQALPGGARTVSVALHSQAFLLGLRLAA